MALFQLQREYSMVGKITVNDELDRT